MILLSSAVRIYVAVEPVNMRRSFDGLVAQVRSVLAQDRSAAKVIVRVDRREVLACEPCEGELVRAPVGDKVISGCI